MGVKVKMVAGDQMAIAQETARQLGLGTNILDASGLGDTKQQETAASARPSNKRTVSPRYFPRISSISWKSCSSVGTSSA